MDVEMLRQQVRLINFRICPSVHQSVNCFHTSWSAKGVMSEQFWQTDKRIPSRSCVWTDTVAFWTLNKHNKFMTSGSSAITFIPNSNQCTIYCPLGGGVEVRKCDVARDDGPKWNQHGIVLNQPPPKSPSHHPLLWMTLLCNDCQYLAVSALFSLKTRSVIYSFVSFSRYYRWQSYHISKSCFGRPNWRRPQFSLPLIPSRCLSYLCQCFVWTLFRSFQKIIQNCCEV